MVKIHTIDINPPLINSSCAWASDFAQLRELYDCPYTGAITTRTATLKGFREDNTHTVTFSASTITSLNSYGYSPHPFTSYAEWVYSILTTPTVSGAWPTKPIIISITSSTPDDLSQILDELQMLRMKLNRFHVTRPRDTPAIDPSDLLALELNTSCPNIKGSPPPAYNFSMLRPLLDQLASAWNVDPSLTIGLKLPPYIDIASMQDVVRHLAQYSRSSPDSVEGEMVNPFAFVTCTNTLGSCLFFDDQVNTGSENNNSSPFALPTPLGGLGGESLHPLALGNVYTFSKLFAEHHDPSVRRIAVIGVGGVTSLEARQRMIKAGASVVGCATLLGQKGVRAFELLTNGEISE